MKFINVADEIIPGYSVLPEEVRKNFESSVVGEAFIIAYLKLIESSIADAAGVEKNNKGWLNSEGWKNWWNGELAQSRTSIRDNFSQQKDALLEELYKTEPYNALIHSSDTQILQLLYPDSLTFSPELLQKFTTYEHAKHLAREVRSKLKPQNEASDKALTNLLKKLNSEKDSIIDDFEKKFYTDPQVSSVTKQLKINYYVASLANYLPLIQNTPIAENLKTSYESKPEFSADQTIDKKAIEDFFFDCLNANSSTLIQFDDFNRAEARFLSQSIYKAFLEGRRFYFNTWLNAYEQELRDFVNAKFSYNQKSKDLTSLKKKMVDQSLSYLWSNKNVEEVTNFVKGMADAKSFLHYFGITSQNDDIALSALDLYNCFRYRTQAAEAKGIIKSLLKPFSPLYKEYSQIANYQQNPVIKVIRALMPVLIVVGAIVLTAFLLSPLGLPELAFLAAFIPAVIVGLALATMYVCTKNYLYTTARKTFYGSIWNTPEYKATPALKAAFGDDLAIKIRNFYINELKEANKEKARFAKMLALTKEEKRLKEENLDNLQSLYLEWLDLSINKREIDKESLHAIVYERLAKKHNSQYQTLIAELGQPIAETTQFMTKQVEERISKYNTKDKVTPFKSFAKQTFFGKASVTLVNELNSTIDFMAEISPAEPIPECN